MNSLLFVLIIFLTVNYGHSSTDISLNNCPDEFNITLANDTTGGTGTNQIGVFYFSTFMTQDRKERVENIIIQSDW